jgi:hypothetical protein
MSPAALACTTLLLDGVPSAAALRAAPAHAAYQPEAQAAVMLDHSGPLLHVVHPPESMRRQDEDAIL